MIEIKNISKDYEQETGYNISLFRDISFDIENGSITSVIAPSGAGKTSLLKILSGLVSQTFGSISTNSDKPILFIPSEPSSFPWLNVMGNILFGMKTKNDVEIKKLIKLVGLEGYETYYPRNRSLGFRFRIALARSLVRQPILICLDEPFNKMDDVTKGEIYNLIRELNNSLGTTFLIATTNISEAIYLSDKIHLMKKNPGEIFQSFSVNLPKERNFSLISSFDFMKLREKVENSFKLIETQRLFNISI